MTSDTKLENGMQSVCCSYPDFPNFFLSICLFIYLWLCWVFVSVPGLSLVVASGGHSSSQCAGLSLSWPLLLRSTGSRRAGSVIVAHGPSCPAACGILPLEPVSPALAGRLSTTAPPGKPCLHSFSEVLDHLHYHYSEFFFWKVAYLHFI